MKTTRLLKQTTSFLALFLLALCLQSFRDGNKKQKKNPPISSNVEFLKLEKGQYLFQLSYSRPSAQSGTRPISVSIEANNGVELFNQHYRDSARVILFRINEAEIERLVFIVGNAGRENLHEFSVKRTYKEETWFSKL